MIALSGIAVIGSLTLLLGGALEWVARRLRPTGIELVDAIDALLPQTQCERCGYKGCRPYADAIASGTAINRCPPGGAATIEALAGLLDRDVIVLDAALQPMNPDAVALIDESRCIGCALCLPPCPVDAIVGAAGHMHTVIARQCTGCELCIPACPVDCITIVVATNAPLPQDVITRAGYAARRTADARRRYELRSQRVSAESRAAETRRRQRQDRLAGRQPWDDA